MSVSAYGTNDTSSIENDAQETVRSSVDSLRALIDPTEVDKTADSWDDVDHAHLSDELAKCTAEADYFSRFDDVIHTVAVARVRDRLTRAPLEHLVFGTAREAVANGYWPHKTDYRHVTELIEDTHAEEGTTLYRRAEREAYEEVVLPAVYDALDPRE